MDIGRNSFQGVINIIRFNWHLYALSVVGLALLTVFGFWAGDKFLSLSYIVVFLAGIQIATSLAVSFYIYDLSGLYKFGWLPDMDYSLHLQILNVNAGFDETSYLLEEKFKNSELVALDFYDAKQHTEASIKRARKAYPAYRNTMNASTHKLPFRNAYFHMSFAVLSAHEIRNNIERASFFKELKRTLKPDGEIVVIEHMRDLNNFLAFNIGCFHFHSKTVWNTTFEDAGLRIDKEIKITPFLTTFILKANGDTF